MSAKNAIFFDIDGTLWGRDNVIPESTKKTIHLLKENGHLVFLCTGRTVAYVYDEELLSLGFDGIVAGCGTRIEYHDEVLFDRTLTQEEALKANTAFQEASMVVLMEGNDYFYANRQELIRDGYGEFLYGTVGKLFLELDEHVGNWQASKFSVLLNGHPAEPVIEKLGDQFDFMVHGTHVMEVVPKGFSKGSGIRHLCEILNISMEHTYAFGDSANDLDMLDTVSIGIAMGNGADVAKEHADYVTDPLHMDGIYNACVHYKLI